MFHYSDTDRGVSRLMRELNITGEEAESLLRRTGFRADEARRLYIREHGVLVEPEKVEDGSRPARGQAEEMLKRLWRRLCSGRIRVMRGEETLASVPVLLALLALLAAPHLTFASVAVMLFMRCRFDMGCGAKACAAP